MIVNQTYLLQIRFDSATEVHYEAPECDGLLVLGLTLSLNLTLPIDMIELLGSIGIGSVKGHRSVSNKAIDEMTKEVDSIS